MPNIIRIRNLVQEFDLNDIILPIDKNTYTENAKRISGQNLKEWILSGFTGTSGGSNGTSGTDGTSGSSGIGCPTYLSNVIEIKIITTDCNLNIIDVTCSDCSLTIDSVICN